MKVDESHFLFCEMYIVWGLHQAKLNSHKFCEILGVSDVVRLTALRYTVHDI